MANKNTPTFSVSVTPKVSLDEINGTQQAMDVIHENVRRTLGGSGTVTRTGVEALGGTGGSWANGTYTQLTNSSNAGAIANDAWLVEIEKNKKQFEMVDLVAPAWTIQVPRRIKK